MFHRYDKFVQIADLRILKIQDLTCMYIKFISI